MYDGRVKLCEAGCRNIHVLNTGDPPGCENPRDRRATGIKMFFDEGLDKKFKCKVSVTDYYELSGNPRKTRRWASSIDPKTDALFGAFDYYVIDAQSWLKRYSKLDWQKLKCLGQSNSTWSHEGPNKFASYDFRLEDLASMALELIDSPPKEPLIRRIRPKLVRQELLA
jgi:DNA-binding LacI/PurR family transcriptional regulator